MTVTNENGTVFKVEIKTKNSTSVVVISWAEHSQVAYHLKDLQKHRERKNGMQIDGSNGSVVDRFKVYVDRATDLEFLTPTNIDNIVNFAKLTALIKKHDEHVTCLLENVDCPLYGLVMKDIGINREYIEQAKIIRQNIFDELEELASGPVCEICENRMPHTANDYETPLCSQECRDQDRQNGKCNWDLDKCKELLDRI